MNAKINNFIHETYYRAHFLSLEYQAEHREKKTVTAYRLHFLDFFYGKLDGFEPEKDQDKYDLFLKGVRNHIFSTKDSESFQPFVQDALKTSYLIRLWMAETQWIASHVRSVGREKNLESSLMKIYNKSDKLLTPQVKDTFGSTWIFNDNNVNTLYSFSNFFIGITTGRNRHARNEFVLWLAANKSISNEDKDAVTRVLTSNMDLDDKGNMHGHPENFQHSLHPHIKIPSKSGSKYLNGLKDYIVEPKENSYQCLQGSFILNGNFLEIQFKTKEMDDNPDADHTKHKEKEKDKSHDIFTLKPSEISELKKYASKLGIEFKAYDSELDDKIGFHFPQFFYTSESICRTPL